MNSFKHTKQLEMWANAQHDGRPAKYTVPRKKWNHSVLPLTLQNADEFSKFFQRQT